MKDAKEIMIQEVEERLDIHNTDARRQIAEEAVDKYLRKLGKEAYEAMWEKD